MYETAHSARVTRVDDGPDVVTMGGSATEASPGKSALAPTARAYLANATALSGPALRQVMPPSVPPPFSASMAAPFAARSRHSSPVRCSPAAVLRVRPAIVSMTSAPGSAIRPRGDGYTVTFRAQSARRSCNLVRPNNHPAGPVPAPHPLRGLPGSGNTPHLSNWQILLYYNSLI